MSKTSSLHCLLVAALCAASLLAWQALTVRFSYAGNSTALFCTGDRFAPPHALAQSENIYLFRHSYGYDGQFFHYIAHDPFFQHGFARNIDVPRMRYRRILMPALAYALALGNPRAIDTAYLAVFTAFVWLGAYWLARLATLAGRAPWWGLLFAAIPGVLISADRLTADVALAALCVGYLLYLRECARAKLFAVVACAALVRETGLLLIAGSVLSLLTRRKLRDAVAVSAAALPALAWYAFVQFNTQTDDIALLSPVLLSGFVRRILIPPPHPFSGVPGLAWTLDLLALSAMAVTLGWVVYRGWRRAWTPAAAAMYLFALLTISLSSDLVWAEVYGFGRTLTPLLLLAAYDGLTVRSSIPAVAMFAMDPRIILQLGGQIVNVIRGIVG